MSGTPHRRRGTGGLAGPGERRLLVSLLALIVLAGAAPQAIAARAAKEATLSCPAANAQPITPDAIHGVVSRAEINPKLGNGIVSTVQPALANLDVATWARNLEGAGVNIAELYIQPDTNLAPAEAISGQTWRDYLDAALIPDAERTPGQRETYRSVRQKMTGRNGATAITDDQQEQVHIAFLERLEALKKAGKICGNIQFVVLERRWFQTAKRNPIPEGVLERQFGNETVFARTMADFLKRVAAAGLDHWLAGILVIEHTNTDMNQVLPITLDLAARINGLTNGWLKSHFMGMAGGGFGDQFNGIDKVVCPAGAAQSGSGYQFTCKPGEPLDFFRLISQETGTFAFAYKFFNWRTAPTPASYCNGCDPQNMSVINWAGYLGDSERGLGFSDLASFVAMNAAAYPKAANVIYIGNASDNLFKMIEAGNGPPDRYSAPRPQLTALSALFRNGASRGGGWAGRIFMDGYEDNDRRIDPAQTPVDDGTSLFHVDYSHMNFAGGASVTPNPQSQAFWRSWPSLP